MNLEFSTRDPDREIVYSDKGTSLSMSYDGVPVDYFDREGRLVGTFVDGHHYRRGFDNRLLEKFRSDDGRQRVRRDVLDPRKREIIDSAYTRAHELWDSVERGDVTEFRPQGLGARVDPDRARAEVLDRIAPILRFGYGRLVEDGERFRGIYAPVSILPPDQYLALVVQMTVGCSWNKCTFCDFYRDRPFSIKSPDELREHIGQLEGFYGESTWLRKSIFLLDGNALVIPQAKLLERLDVVHEFFEFVPPDMLDPVEQSRWRREHPHGFDGLYSFLDAFSTVKKSVEEWRELRARHVIRVYIGLETGDDELLRFVNKPGDGATMVDATRTIKAAGINVGVIAMVGVGGGAFAAQHVRNTVQAINAMELGEGDIVYLSDFVNHPGLPYEALAHEQGVTDLDWQGVVAQREEIKRALHFPDPKRPPKVALYDIREMIY